MVKGMDVNLCGIDLQNPVIPASGTFGFGTELAEAYDLNILGAISLKGTTREARYGNPTPRIAECEQGMINAVGLQNPGIDVLIEKKIPELRKIYHNPIIANLSGFSIEEYTFNAEQADKCPDIDIIEINISCPNVRKGGMAFGTDAKMAQQVTSEVRKVVANKPLFIKLSPNVTDIVSIAKACQDGGADGLTLVNTFLGMRIDIKRRCPVIKNRYGGFSGKAIFPIALRMVNQVALACPLPIMGCGGISTAQDVIEMMMAGATAVQVGAENIRNPYACKQIIENLPEVMQKLNIEKLSDIISIV